MWRLGVNLDVIPAGTKDRKFIFEAQIEASRKLSGPDPNSSWSGSDGNRFIHHLSSPTLPPLQMFSFAYQAKNDYPTSQSVFEVPQTPQSSSYLDLPLVPVRFDQATCNTDSADSSKNARQRKQGCKSGSRWSYSQLDTGRANKSEPMYLYDFERNDDSNSELDTSFSPKPTISPDTPSYGTLDDEMTFLKTPSPSFFRHLSLIKPLRKHPFSRHYEVPEWRSLIIHTFLCFLSYPVLLGFVRIAEDRTLFWTRVLVGIGSGVTGMLLGRSLVLLSARHLEATVWATVIHQSQIHDSPGVQFKDIAKHVDDPTSVMNGIRLLWDRLGYSGTARKNRAHYDTRPWSIHALFFLIAFALSAALPFIFGRIVDIKTSIHIQLKKSRYTEVAMNASISDADNERALAIGSLFTDSRLIWTLTSYSSHGGLPVVEFSWTDAQANHSDVVYFSQPTRPQLQPGGHGLGTFGTEAIALGSSIDTPTIVDPDIDAHMAPGNIIRQPQWGVRIKCAKIPDEHILPMSQANQTYVFIPKDTVSDLLDYYGKPFPTSFRPLKPQPDDQEWPLNVKQNDTLAAVPFWQNGITLSYFSKPLYDMGSDGTGFVSLELGLIRLNTSFAAQGQFSVLGKAAPDANDTATHIGYDAAVCIELFEPWVVDVYNSSTGLPTIRRIVEKGNIVRDLEAGTERMIEHPITDPNVKRNLTSDRMRQVYLAAHQNSINQLVKDDGSADLPYVPSTSAIECTDGKGAFGYTSLSAPFFERFRARADANNLLPYMVGSGAIVVRSYPDSVLASATIHEIWLFGVLFSFFALGVFAALFVPKLPKDVPRRGFDLYSWLAAFYADELVMIGKPEGNSGQPGLPIGRKMEIEDIEQHIKDVRVRYAS